MKTNLLLASALAVLAVPALAQSADVTAPAAAQPVDETIAAEAASDAALPAQATPEQVAPPAASQAAADETPVVAEAVAAAGTTEAMPADGKPSVVTRGADGKAEVVSIDGQTYKVCKDDVQDSCINPRTAGLNFGARDLQYWPGRPASEISTPLPATPAAGQETEDAGLPG